MSLQGLSGPIYGPTLVWMSTGVTSIWEPVAFSLKGLPMDALRVMNVAAFALNCVSVSIRGRIDDAKAVSKDAQETTNSLDTDIYQTVYSPKRGRSLVAPAGWAFAIWGPIYIGEALVCVSTLVDDIARAPCFTTAFVTANVAQSLWCASFRPSFMTGPSWKRYVSVAMLGVTAFSLSFLHSSRHAIGTMTALPLTLHYGWTTAATLVNLNGSLAMSNASDQTVCAVGHASAMAATALGVVVTLQHDSPVYGLTVAWALAACASGMKARLESLPSTSDPMTKAIGLQAYLCEWGSMICAGVAGAVLFGFGT